MFSFTRILITPIILGACAVGLLGCGQQGPLYLPKEPVTAKRATLPETLLRALSIPSLSPVAATSPVMPSLPASNPVSQ